MPAVAVLRMGLVGKTLPPTVGIVDWFDMDESIELVKMRPGVNGESRPFLFCGNSLAETGKGLNKRKGRLLRACERVLT